MPFAVSWCQFSAIASYSACFCSVSSCLTKVGSVCVSTSKSWWSALQRFSISRSLSVTYLLFGRTPEEGSCRCLTLSVSHITVSGLSSLLVTVPLIFHAPFFSNFLPSIRRMATLARARWCKAWCMGGSQGNSFHLGLLAEGGWWAVPGAGGTQPCAATVPPAFSSACPWTEAHPFRRRKGVCKDVDS